LARVIVLVLILVVLVLAAGAVLVPRALGLDPAWLVRLRRTLGEARHRAVGLAAEFADFVRMGR